MPRGGKSGSKRGKMRIFSNPEEIEREMNRLHMGDKEEEEGGDVAEEEEDKDEETDSDEEEGNKAKPKGISNLIEIENPNRTKKPVASKQALEKGDAKVELSRREREELEKQKAREHYNKLHAQGKTDQAKADLARLAIIRKQREEASARREMEKKLKDEEGKKGKK